MKQTIKIKRHNNGIRIITFNRPEVLNALDIATMRQFAQIIHELSNDPEMRVLILTGAGKEAFSSGGDLNELKNVTTEAQALDFIEIMGNALLEMERLPIPVIGAINGYALGGGSEIALACDLRIVDEKVRLGFVQVRLAVTPGWGAGQRLLRLVGYSRAMEVLLRGHVMRAHEIESLGLVYKVVEPGLALDEALKLANSIAEMPPKLVKGIKAVLQAGRIQSYEDALQTERMIFPPLWASEEHQEAVEAAFKRQERSNNVG